MTGGRGNREKKIFDALLQEKAFLREKQFGEAIAKKKN